MDLEQGVVTFPLQSKVWGTHAHTPCACTCTHVYTSVPSRACGAASLRPLLGLPTEVSRSPFTVSKHLWEKNLGHRSLAERMFSIIAAVPMWALRGGGGPLWVPVSRKGALPTQPAPLSGSLGNQTIRGLHVGGWDRGGGASRTSLRPGFERDPLEGGVKGGEGVIPGSGTCMSCGSHRLTCDQEGVQSRRCVGREAERGFSEQNPEAMDQGIQATQQTVGRVSGRVSSEQENEKVRVGLAGEEPGSRSFGQPRGEAVRGGLLSPGPGSSQRGSAGGQGGQGKSKGACARG